MAEKRYAHHSYDDSLEPADFDHRGREGLQNVFRHVMDHMEDPSNIENESICTGYMGLAVALYTMRLIGYDVELVKLPPNPRHKSRISFLDGAAGFYAMRCAQSQGKHGVEGLLALAELVDSLHPDECEVLYGRAGYLYALLFARKQMDSPAFAADLVRKLVADIIESGKKNSVQPGTLCWVWKGKQYLGAVHGVAGILFVLLSCQPDEIEPYLGDIERTAEWLLDVARLSSGNFRSSLTSEQDELVHFCHGATGFIPLFCKMCAIFPHKAERFRNLAEETGDVVWRRGLLITKGPGLCHGIGGSVLAFLDVYILTRKSKWLYRAQYFCLYLIQHNSNLLPNADRPYSLYEGAVGTVYALAATLHINKLLNQTTCFPGLGFT